MCKCPSPGGEPLWRVCRHSRNFRPITNPAQTYENRRLPVTSHRFAALWSGYEGIENHGRMHRAGQFPGAARYNILWTDEVRE